MKRQIITHLIRTDRTTRLADDVSLDQHRPKSTQNTLARDTALHRTRVQAVSTRRSEYKAHVTNTASKLVDVALLFKVPMAGATRDLPGRELPQILFAYACRASF